jgi:hypothetical protein
LAFDRNVEAELHHITSPINVTTVGDVDDPHDDPIVENLVDHPELAAPCGVPALQLTPKRLTHTTRILRKWPSDELPTGDSGRLG